MSIPAADRARDRSPGRPDAAVAGEAHRRRPRGAAHLRARQPHQRFPVAPRLRPLHRADRALSCGQRAAGRRAPVDAYLELRNAKEQAQGVEVTDPEGKRPLTSGRGRFRAIVPAHRGRLLPAPPRRWPAGRSRRESRSQGIEPRRDPRRCVGSVAGQRRRIFTSRRRLAGPATPSKTPESFWWYVMLLVLAAAVAESVLASRYLGTQREE